MEWSSLDKKTFKTSVLRLLEEDVIGLSSESKIKYMKKWIRMNYIIKIQQKV
jgi:hypothetical protein